jgi:hypothetical protein
MAKHPQNIIKMVRATTCWQGTMKWLHNLLMDLTRLYNKMKVDVMFKIIKVNVHCNLRLHKTKKLNLIFTFIHS